MNAQEAKQVIRRHRIMKHTRPLTLFLASTALVVAAETGTPIPHPTSEEITRLSKEASDAEAAVNQARSWVKQQEQVAAAAAKELARLQSDAAKPPTIIGYRDKKKTKPILDFTVQNNARNLINAAQVKSTVEAQELARRRAWLAATEQRLAVASHKFGEAATKTMNSQVSQPESRRPSK